jgi:hypothetical protein
MRQVLSRAAMLARAGADAVVVMVRRLMASGSEPSK